MPTQHPHSRPPAMMDVAAAAGVSHQTVSRVLNGTGKVAEPTRERVLKAIADLGYRRNSVARALVTRKSGIIGVLTTTSVRFGPSSSLLAVELAAREAGFFTAVAPVTSFTKEEVGKVLDHFLGLAVEGIIIVAPVVELIDELAEITVPVPVVAVTSAVVGEFAGVIPVSVDQEGGARQAVEHLVGMGHRDIAHIPGPMDWFDAQARQAGWRGVLESHGLPVREPMVGGWDASTGYEVGQVLLHEDLPTAVFAANDELALGLMHAFHEVGVRVPEDVSVIGFDDAPASEFFIPGLTTVRQDFHALGAKAVDTMVRAIAGSGSLRRTQLPAELIVRSSVAPPRVWEGGH